MRYSFVKFGITSNLNLDENQKDFFFFDQNREKFNQIFEFLSGPKSCFVLSGFQGTGKTKIINEALSYLNKEVLLFKYNMYESTTLDDILMNLTIDFREYHKNNQTTLPKIDTKDFRERIQYYVKSIEKPMLLVLESYENILKFEDTYHIINEFLLHLASIDKFKIIFVSRNFNTQIFKEHNLEFEKSIVTSIDEDRIGNYLQSYGLTTSNESLQKLISNSHCYLRYIDMTIKILQTFNITLDELMNEFEVKKTNYSTYLINKFISLIPEKAKETVFILTLIRQGVSATFLNNLNKNNINTINYLKNILVLNEEKNNLFIKDYFKKELTKEIDQFSTLKIHSYLADLYENMLPKKPNEREITISRSTMRRERDYHYSFIENYKHLTKKQSSPQISYEEPILQKQEAQPIEPSSQSPTDYSILAYGAAADPEFLTQRKEPRIDVSYQMSDYIKLAEKYENDFDYPTAIFYYQRALEKNTDKAFELNRPTLLMKVANCYIKTHKHENAIQCLELAYELFSAQKQFSKANETLYTLALEYKNNYKFFAAKSHIEKILNSPIENSSDLIAESYNLLADIEDLSGNIKAAKTLYKKSLDYAIKTENPKLLSTAYFKYGLLLDDTNQQTQAIECYKKCIEICSNPETNLYLSSAYSNLAGIYYERAEKNIALNYYQKALEADKITKNNEGIYFVYSKLSEMYEQTNKENSYKFLLNALQAAKRLNDELYIASAYLKIGDYYYRQKDFVQAIKAYLSAKHFLNNETTKENKATVETRLKDLKIKLGEKLYTQTTENFRYNDGN